MNLAEIILENERTKQIKKNENLIRIKLKTLVFTYPSEVTRVLQSTGIKLKSDMPASVILAVVLKHVASNSEMREAISEMLLEMDSYMSADGGNTWGLVGGALSAVGSVLSGISRSQSTTNTDQTSIQQQQEFEKQLAEEQAKRTRNTWLVVGISFVVIVGIIMAFKYGGKTPKIESKIAVA